MARPKGPARLRVAGQAVNLRGIQAAGDDYDPTAIYCGGVDSKGHSENRRLRMHPDVTAEIERLVASGALSGTAIQSFGDFMRDAAVHQMHRISRMVDDKHFTEAAADARRMARAETIAREQDGKAKLVEACNDQINKAMSAKDHAVVRELVELYEPITERIREPYASQVEDVLKSARRWQSTQENDSR